MNFVHWTIVFVLHWYISKTFWSRLMQPTDSAIGFFGIKAVSKESLLNFSPGIAQRAGSVLLYFAMIRSRGSNFIESCQLNTKWSKVEGRTVLCDNVWHLFQLLSKGENKSSLVQALALPAFWLALKRHLCLVPWLGKYTLRYRTKCYRLQLLSPWDILFF